MSNLRFERPPAQASSAQLPRLWRWIVIVVLFLGIFFRVSYLERKVYWVDEVATSIRVAGYTRTEVIQQVSQGQVLSPQDLLQFQQLTPDRSIRQTWQALVKSPEHAPLYFLLTRLWAEGFGSSVVAMRSLSVLFSLLALPCLYGFVQELFKSPFIASIAVVLASVSPFFVAYAQEARPYSLWILTLILSGWLLLRGLRLGDRGSWFAYAICLSLGFYTSLLSIFVAIAQGIYVFITGRLLKQYQMIPFRNWAIAAGLAGLSFTPWIIVILQHWQKLQDNTTWMQSPMDLAAMIAIWLYSIVILFVDFPVYLAFDPVIVSAVLADIGLITLVGYSFYFLCRRTLLSRSFFVVTLTFSTLSFLIVLDLVLQTQTSTAPRYWMPAHLGILLAIAHLFGQKLSMSQVRLDHHLRLWKLGLIILISMGVISCGVNLKRSPRFQKTRNLHNGAIATLINQADNPMVLTESSQTLDLLSLSHDLVPQARIQILPSLRSLTDSSSCQSFFVFNPSETFTQTLKQQYSEQIRRIYQPKLLIPGEISLTLWQVDGNTGTCSPSRSSSTPNEESWKSELMISPERKLPPS
ncbi:MAG: glycosyltransferase family 39 protein [Oculatellaceae cyanobacterium Prado106]|nr:glycosyltransferase family 39 protein [Oculatellaceae cyanobacterium Prado106]